MAEGLRQDLARVLGEGGVSTAPEDLERFSTDALGRYRAFRAASRLGCRPAAVARPAQAEQVAAVLELASRTGTPVVPYGGGTGVMGGAVAVEGAIALDLKDLRKVISVDGEGHTALVEAGAVLGDLEQALNRQGLMLGHDPWSLPIATVGGAISTNGVGYRAGKYGAMGQQVLGLEVALPDGLILQTRAVPQKAGPSLDSLFIGTEGTLGIITKATLEVFPLPERRGLHAFSLSGFEAGFAAVMELFALGLRPALVDFAEEHGSPGAEAEVETTLYLGFEGLREEVLAQEERALRILKKHGGQDRGPGVAQQFWERRHDTALRYRREVLEASPAQRRSRPWRMDYLHVALPSRQVLEYRRWCRQVLAARGIFVREWSLWGRPELFSFLLVDPTPAGEEASQGMAQAVDELLMVAQDLGGSMEYCHGVGIKLGHLMERELGVGMEVLRRLKRAVDPAGILNPGKLGL